MEEDFSNSDTEFDYTSDDTYLPYKNHLILVTMKKVMILSKKMKMEMKMKL